MRGRRSNIIAIVVVLGFLVFLSLTSRPARDWQPTWHQADKDPYGGFVLHGMLDKQGVHSEYRSLYELINQHAGDVEDQSLLVISSYLNLDTNDYKSLVKHVRAGNTAVMASNVFGQVMYDSLGVRVEQLVTSELKDWEKTSEEVTGTATVDLRFSTPGFPKKTFQLPAAHADTYFEKSDSIPHTGLASIDGEDVAREYRIGGGRLILITNPLLLSNYFILDTNASEVAAGLLSFLPPDRPVAHIEFYQVGRMESQTPFRFFLSQPALRTSLYLVLLAITLFMIFEARRRQRIIPVVEPPKNSSVQFTQTLGQLYYKSRSNHLNMARKRVNYLLEYIRSHYYIATEVLDENFEKELKRRSGRDQDLIRELLEIVRLVQSGRVNEKEFLRLEVLLEEFYSQQKSTDKKPENGRS